MKNEEIMKEVLEEQLKEKINLFLELKKKVENA